MAVRVNTTAQVEQALARCGMSGLNKEDGAAIVKIYEQMAGVALGLR
jgi:hypothetical protein